MNAAFHVSDSIASKGLLCLHLLHLLHLEDPKTIQQYMLLAPPASHLCDSVQHFDIHRFILTRFSVLFIHNLKDAQMKYHKGKQPTSRFLMFLDSDTAHDRAHSRAETLSSRPAGNLWAKDYRNGISLIHTFGSKATHHPGSASRIHRIAVGSPVLHRTTAVRRIHPRIDHNLKGKEERKKKVSDDVQRREIPRDRELRDKHAPPPPYDPCPPPYPIYQNVLAMRRALSPRGSSSTSRPICLRSKIERQGTYRPVRPGNTHLRPGTHLLQSNLIQATKSRFNEESASQRQKTHLQLLRRNQTTHRTLHTHECKQ
jgi:hypothetical protein